MNRLKSIECKAFPVPPNWFYINRVSISEALGILIKEFNTDINTDKEGAKRKIKEWISKFPLAVIQYDAVCESYEEIARQANSRVIRKKGDNYKVGESDMRIIAGFLKEKVNIVHVRDKGFEETCKELGLKVIPTPKKDTDKESFIKKKFKRTY